MQEPTRELVAQLAAANGLTIPEERLDLVLRQYQEYLETLRELAKLELPRETEPAIIPVTPGDR